MKYTNRVLSVGLILATISTTGLAAEKTGLLLKQINAVGDRGRGNVTAAKAVKKLSQADAAELPTILQAFEGAGPLAANWLRGAVETIADRAIKDGGQLPEK